MNGIDNYVNSQCNLYYIFVDGDTCENTASYFNVDLNTFTAINPLIDCSSPNIGDRSCLAISGVPPYGSGTVPSVNNPPPAVPTQAPQSLPSSGGQSSLTSGGDNLNTVFGGFTAAGKIALLTQHNLFRSQIAMGTYYAKGVQKGPATNMAKLVWSNTLEQTAQAHSNGCVFAHSTNLATLNAGENLWETWGSGVTMQQSYGNTSSISWANEFQQFGWAGNMMTNALFSSGVGHATQMAWAQTTKMGCGMTFCPGSTVLITCQYSPPGNYMNQAIYLPGTTCSQCPSGLSCDANGLCA